MVGRGGSGLGWGYDRDENINNGSQMILSRTHISIPMQNYQEILRLISIAPARMEYHYAIVNVMC